MKFKELTKIPIEQCFGALPPTEIFEQKSYGGGITVYDRDVYTYQATRFPKFNDLLIITVFQGGFFKYRIFLTEEEFCNQIVDRKKPSESMLWNIKIPHSSYYSRYVPTEDADAVIAAWLKGKYFGDAKYREDRPGIYLIQSYQEMLRGNDLKAKYNRIKNSVDIEMLKITELPLNINKWINTHTFQDRHYIFYHPTEHWGECSGCGKRFEISPQFLKHNATHFCPHCKSKAKLISGNRWKHMNRLDDSTEFAYIQPTRKGFCVRKFSATKYISNKADYRNETENISQGEMFKAVIDIHEYKRDFFENDSHLKSFMYGNFYQTGERRWCPSSLHEDRYYTHRGIAIYPNNLGSIVKRDEKLKYIPVQKIVKLSNELNFIDVMRNCRKYPFIEYLYKMGFHRLTVEICRYGEMYSDRQTREHFGLNYDGKSIMELLGVGKQEIKLLSELNVSSVELELYKTVKNNFDLEAFKWYQKTFKGDRKDTFFDMLKLTTLAKAAHWVQKQSEICEISISDVLHDWSDYHFECGRLNYPQTRDVLFPPDLQTAHEHTTTLVRLLNEKGRCEKCRVGCENQAELLKEIIYQDKDFIIRPALTPEEIISEGAILGHCVGGYLERHSEGKTHILVLRKLTEPDKPFYTVEIGKNYSLVQIRGKKNCAETPEVKAFRQKWEKRLKSLKQKEGAA